MTMNIPMVLALMLHGHSTSRWHSFNWSSVDTIPFNFNFNGSPVSTFKVSSSGVLTFTTNAGIAPTAANASIPDPGIPNNSIMYGELKELALMMKLLPKLGNLRATILISLVHILQEVDLLVHRLRKELIKNIYC